MTNYTKYSKISLMRSFRCVRCGPVVEIRNVLKKNCFPTMFRSFEMDFQISFSLVNSTNCFLVGLSDSVPVVEDYLWIIKNHILTKQAVHFSVETFVNSEIGCNLFAVLPFGFLCDCNFSTQKFPLILLFLPSLIYPQPTQPENEGQKGIVTIWDD